MTLEVSLEPGAGRALARLAKHVELALADVDLSPAQYRALLFLSGGRSAPSALAGLLAVSKPSITALADGLVNRGFLERRPDPEDRRRVQHVLTAAGRKALRAGDAAVDARLASLLDHLDDADRARAVAGVEAWTVALDRAREAKLAR